MSSPRRGFYRMQKQLLFKNAPIVKAWLISNAICSTMYMYISHSRMNFPAVVTPRDIGTTRMLYRFFLWIFVFGKPSAFVSGIVLLYYYRWLERRFGTSKFLDFIIINHLQSFLIEVCIYLLIAMLGHDHSSIYLARGPYSLFTALYFLYLREIPVVPYASLFGISISAHTLPIIMFIHLFDLTKSSLIACLSGLLSYLIYTRWSYQLHFVPVFFIRLFSSNENIIGWLAEKFAEFGEYGREGRILPVAATVERQLNELLDEYEGRLMLAQMRLAHRSQQGIPPDNQLRYLNRLWNIPQRFTGGRSEATEEQIRHLMDMGLGSRQMVVEALQMCGNDTSAAAHQLLDRRR